MKQIETDNNNTGNKKKSDFKSFVEVYRPNKDKVTESKIIS